MLNWDTLLRARALKIAVLAPIPSASPNTPGPGRAGGEVSFDLGFHFLDEREPRAAREEVAFNLGFPFRLVALDDPGRQRGPLVFRQPFDRVLDLLEVHTPMLLRAGTVGDRR